MKVYSKYSFAVGAMIAILTLLFLHRYHDSMPAWFLWISAIWNIGLSSLFFRQAFRPPTQKTTQAQS
jgi:hypothetical protein